MNFDTDLFVVSMKCRIRYWNHLNFVSFVVVFSFLKSCCHSRFDIFVCFFQLGQLGPGDPVVENVRGWVAISAGGAIVLDQGCDKLVVVNPSILVQQVLSCLDGSFWSTIWPCGPCRAGVVSDVMLFTKLFERVWGEGWTSIRSEVSWVARRGTAF